MSLTVCRTPTVPADPDSDAQWGKYNQVARQRGGEIEIEKTPLSEMPDELKKLLDD